MISNINLLKNLEVDANLFSQIVDQKKNKGQRPSILTFITPHLKFFDISRLIKLSQFNKCGFEIVIILEKSLDPSLDRKFNGIIDKFIPSNKCVFYYENIMEEMIKDYDYNSLLLSYQSKNLLSMFQKENRMRTVSLLDINRFISQYFLIMFQKKYLHRECDFFLTTPYKNCFFKTIPDAEKNFVSVSILLKDYQIDWGFNSSIHKLKKIIEKMGLNSNNPKNIWNLIAFFTELMGEKSQEFSSKKDFIALILEIKKFIEEKKKMSEYLVGRENFQNVIFTLDNKLRRQIISILILNDKMKAEEIKKLINKSAKRKYSLANIMKHLNILVRSKILIKNKREYKRNTERIIIDIPLSWFKEERFQNQDDRGLK